MTITINGTGTITGIIAGGLPDAIITQPELATGVAGTGPAFSAYHSATQTISNATQTKVLFQTEDFDTNSCYDTSNSRFTPTVAGYYQITTAFNVPSTSRASEVQLYVYKNGVLWKSGFDQVATTYNAETGCLVFCNGSTDYIEIYVYLGTGGTTQAFQQYTYFQAAMVRSA
jgi:hypothetical protein